MFRVWHCLASALVLHYILQNHVHEIIETQQGANNLLGQAAIVAELQAQLHTNVGQEWKMLRKIFFSNRKNFLLFLCQN